MKLLGLLLAVLVLAGCGEDSSYRADQQREERMYDACVAAGGTFEHEDTSVGSHWWCKGAGDAP